MQFTREMINVLFAYLISTPLTNFGRAQNSNRNSNDNQRNVQAFQETKGWSPQFPAVVVSMHNWPCNKGPDFPVWGCTAQEYIDAAMKRRAEQWEEFKNAINAANLEGEKLAAAKRELQAFEDIFTDGKGQLIQLTLDNAYWVHSGHQRSEYVFLAAYAEFLRRKETHDPDADEYHLTVPAIVGTYTDILDLLEDQVAANSSATIQNKLQPLDYAKTAVKAIGTGMTPRISESRFRRWGAEKQGGKNNTGAYPRWGYKLAELNWRFRQKPGFYDALVAPATIKAPGEKEAIPNPEYIDYREVALTHEDPMCNAAVLSRLLDFDLLKDYDNKYGSGNEDVIAKRKENPLSDAEKEVLRRSLEAGKAMPWTEEEFVAWMETKKHGVHHVGPRKEPPKKVYKTEDADKIMKSEAAPQLLKDFLSEHVFGNENGADYRISQRVDAIDFVYQLDPANEDDASILEALTVLSTFREGNPEGYGKFVAQFKKTADKYLPKPAVAETVPATSDTQG